MTGRTRGWGRGASAVAAFLLLFKIPGLILIPLFPAAVLLVSPMILGRFGRLPDRSIRWLAPVIAVAALWGSVLRWTSTSDEGRSTGIHYLSLLLWLAAFVLVPAGGYFLSRMMGVRRVVLAATLGGAVSTIWIDGGWVWKGDLGAYLTIFALALLARHVALMQVVLIASAVVSALSDARGMALFAGMAFLASLVPQPTRDRIRQHPVRWLVGMALVAGMATWGFYHVSLNGWLGHEVQERTMAESATGNPILATRVEWVAAGTVFHRSPLGYGTGVTVGPGVQNEAIKSITEYGGDYTNLQYWQGNVFGDRSDFHSILINLWYHFSVPGVALALLLSAILIRLGLRTIGRSGEIGVLGVYVATHALWDLLYSPMGSSTEILLGTMLAACLASGVRWGPPQRTTVNSEPPRTLASV